MSPQLRDRISRTVGVRIGLTVAAVSLAAAATTAGTLDATHADARPVHSSVRVPPRQVSSEIQALQAKGYVPYQCTVTGTLMRDARGNSVSIDW